MNSQHIESYWNSHLFKKEYEYENEYLIDHNVKAVYNCDTIWKFSVNLYMTKNEQVWTDANNKIDVISPD